MVICLYNKEVYMATSYRKQLLRAKRVQYMWKRLDSKVEAGFELRRDINGGDGNASCLPYMGRKAWVVKAEREYRDSLPPSPGIPTNLDLWI